MTKISDFAALLGANVDTAADVLPIVDDSESGTDRNKKITVAELLGLIPSEVIDDRVAALLVASGLVEITYDDAGNTLTIDVPATGSGDISDFNEAVDDRVAALIDGGAGITLTYDDSAGTLTINAASSTPATAAQMWTGTSEAVVATPKALFDTAAFQALTDGATITPDFGAGLNFKVTLGGNRTLANPSNAKDGQSGVIRVIQDATGSRTLAFGSNWRFPGGAASGGVLSTAANSIDVIAYVVGESGLIYATLSKAFAA